MSILKLVSKNLFRRKGRFIFTLLGISIGMAAFAALLSLGGSMRGEVKKQAEALGANFLIVPENICVYNQMAILTGDTISESLRYDVFTSIAGLDGITVIPHLTQRTAINNIPRVIVGILPEETRSFRGWVIGEGEYFSAQDEKAVIIGASLAEMQNLVTGEVLTVRGEDFRIKGILGETKSNDDMTVFIPLTVAQRIFDRENEISYMSAKVENMADMERYEAAVLEVASVQVATDEQLLGAVMTIVNSVNVTLQLIAGVALIAAAFGIVNTMMTAIYERRREIGILRAIGGKTGEIFKIFIIESGLYGLLGGVIGVAAGIAASFAAAPILTQGEAGELLKGASPGADFDIFMLAATILLSLFIAVVSGLYPAWQASKLTPAEAVSYE
ncbi:MAG: ABC transporter permease [Oscillospiraceae bacterium]|nr:ABC transporter permease [Oscillospiraceae bacterium]